MAEQKLEWEIAPVTWGVIIGWSDINWYTEIMDPGLLSEGFFMDPLDLFPLFLHALLWDFPTIHNT